MVDDIDVEVGGGCCCYVGVGDVVDFEFV